MKDKIDAILIFAYGEGKKINGRLFSIAKKYSQIHKAPLFLQKDMSLVDEFDEYCLEAKNPPIYIAKQEGDYISSLQIIDGFLGHPLKEKWNNVLIIAAPQHVRRCLEDCRMECKDTIFYVLDIKEDSTWYDPTDPQKWVRNPWTWWRQEFLIRLIRFISYKFYANKARSHKRR